MLSARTERALRAGAARLREHIESQPDHDPLDIAVTLATARTAFEHRAAITAAEPKRFAEALTALAEAPRPASSGRRLSPTAVPPCCSRGRAASGAGWDANWPRASRCSRTHWTRCSRSSRHADATDCGTPCGGTQDGPLDRTEFAQPGLFAVGVGLFRLFESWGAVPDYVGGHSVGEITAAHVAGVLSLADACALVAARGRLMQTLPETGSMLAVQASEQAVLPLLVGVEDRVAVAAVNGPGSLVLSGQHETITALENTLKGQGRRTSRLRTSHAFHSPLMEPILDDFRTSVGQLDFRAPLLPMVSALTGALAEPEDLCTPDYWVRHVRQPVRFADGVTTLYEQGVRTFLELGPDAVLTTMVRENLAGEPAVVTVPALRRDRSETESVTSALAHAHTAGVPVGWEAFFGARRAGADLPAYPFRRERLWLAQVPAESVGPGQTGPAIRSRRAVALADGQRHGPHRTGSRSSGIPGSPTTPFLDTGSAARHRLRRVRPERRQQAGMPPSRAI